MFNDKSDDANAFDDYDKSYEVRFYTEALNMLGTTKVFTDSGYSPIKWDTLIQFCDEYNIVDIEERDEFIYIMIAIDAVVNGVHYQNAVARAKQDERRSKR